MTSLTLIHIVLIYLAVVNVVTFFMFGIDKWKAKECNISDIVGRHHFGSVHRQAPMGCFQG